MNASSKQHLIAKSSASLQASGITQLVEYEPMSFQNECVPKPEDEQSEFLSGVRIKMRLGFVSDDQWTFDRNRDMVLVRLGSGHEVDTKDEEYWSFFGQGREYRFRTKRLVMRAESKETVRMERSIRFFVMEGFSEPNDPAVQAIKEALTAFKDFGTLSRYRSCDLVLTTDSGEVL